MTFRNLALRTKIILIGNLPLILLVFLTVVATLSVNSLLSSSQWVDHTHTVIGEAMKIEAAAVDMETGMRGYLLAGKEEFLAPYNQGNKSIHDLLGKLKRTVEDNPSQVKLLNEIGQTVDGWKGNVVEPVIALRKRVGNGKTMNDIAKIVGEARGKAYFDKFREQIKTFREREEKLMGLRQAEAMNTADTTKNILLFGTLLTILAATALSWLMGRSIVNPLNGIIYGLNDGSDQMAASSSQLASSSQQMSMGASDQAASIEETSSSLEQMASMTRQNADNAKQADNLMAETNKTVGHANKSMNDLTVSMEEISKASEETSKIIKTIDEIAFQTNLLALNAAVEAARAGDAGAGFAVVADEVRNLAMRAADAAKNTANLIEGTVKKVNDGTEIVTVTNEAFKEVADNSGKVGALVEEISAASVEQAQGIEQINKAIAQMDQVVQRNSATAEENASSSEEMSSQAEQMKAYVNELNAMVEGNKKRLVTGSPVSALPPARKGLPANTGQPTNTGTAAIKAREVTPDQVIPLDDDDFANF